MRLTLFGTVFDSAFYILPPLPRCGSVVLDFMMRFNRSVVVSNVLTVLLDAARQDKFGGFKVDPESIKQVFIATDGSESTTKGKFYKEILFLIVYAYWSEDGLFLIVFSICLIKKTQFCESYISKFCFCRCRCFIQLNKILLLKNYYRESSTLVPSQLELAVFVHERKLGIESSVLTTITVNVV